MHEKAKPISNSWISVFFVHVVGRNSNFVVLGERLGMTNLLLIVAQYLSTVKPLHVPQTVQVTILPAFSISPSTGQLSTVIFWVFSLSTNNDLNFKRFCFETAISLFVFAFLHMFHDFAGREMHMQQVLTNQRILIEDEFKIHIYGISHNLF